MRRPFLILAFVSLASMGTTAAACSIRGIADGVQPADAGFPDGGGESGVAACAADLAHDAKNCGRCGRVCSGPCDDGVCDVSTIADGLPPVSGLATNGTFVAWITIDSRLAECPVAGCATPTVLATGGDMTGHLTVNGDFVLFTTGAMGSHGVRECQLSDCTNDISIAFDIGLPSALVSDQADVFVLEPAGRRVLRCGLGAGCDQEIARNTAADGDIALGLSNVYWSVLASPAGIYSCPRAGCDGGTPGVFASALTTPRALAVDLHEVRWTSYDEGIVFSCPLTGCEGAPKVLARDQKNPLGIASDGTRVYWVNVGDGTIMTCEATSCAGTLHVIVRNLDRPKWVTLDSTHVYFATASGLVGRTLK